MQPRIQTLEEFKKVMRSNSYLTDPLSEMATKHVYERCGIRPRPQHLVMICSDEKPRHFGGIDSKVTSTSLHKANMGVYMASGPSRDGCPAFSLE